MSEKEKILTATPNTKTHLQILRDQYSAAESQRMYFEKRAAKLSGEIAYEEHKAKGWRVGGVVVESGKRFVISSMTNPHWLRGYALKKDGTPGGQERNIYHHKREKEGSPC